jgi:hypothetical protein
MRYEVWWILLFHCEQLQVPFWSCVKSLMSLWVFRVSYSILYCNVITYRLLHTYGTFTFKQPCAWILCDGFPFKLLETSFKRAMVFLALKITKECQSTESLSAEISTKAQNNSKNRRMCSLTILRFKQHRILLHTLSRWYSALLSIFLCFL